MTKLEALELIDNHKNRLINPVEMLQWTQLRVIILSIEDETWDKAFEKALSTLSR